MPVWSIVLLIVIAVLIAALVALTIVGRKLQKKQEANNAQLEAAKQVMSMLVIDKKMMKMKDAGLPKMVLDQTPKAFRGRKMPIVKAKIGPRVMSLMCDPKVFDQIPIKAEVKAEVSGIYIVGIKSVRGGKIVVPEKKKKGLFNYIYGAIGHICYIPRRFKCNKFRKHMRYSQPVTQGKMQPVAGKYDIYIAGSDQICPEHIAEAVQYRSFQLGGENAR